jgi:hypothetical protein
MLAKAWRVYKIFETTPKMKRIVIKDIRLVAYIVCLVAVDCVVILLWQMFDTVKLKPRYVYETQFKSAQLFLPPSYSSVMAQRQQSQQQQQKQSLSSLLPPPPHFLFTNTNTIINNYMNTYDVQNFSSSMSSFAEVTAATVYNIESVSVPIVKNSSHINQLRIVFECNSSYDEVWLTILTMYKIILLMYGIYLAWIIRNVNVPSMNDSKYLLLSTYTIIICGLGSMTLMQVNMLKCYNLCDQILFAVV